MAIRSRTATAGVSHSFSLQVCFLSIEYSLRSLTVKPSHNCVVTGVSFFRPSLRQLCKQGWVQDLVSRWGTNANGGLRYYILDNEPSIWHGTHRDVHPTGATMDEIKNKILDYAGKIKAADPSALVVGPEEWGWSGYLFSGYDQQYGSTHGWSSLPDRNNHGGVDYLPWLLDQLRQNNTATGKRLLDIFTVHYYPQGGEFSNDVSSAMQLRRNRSTRSLWDPNYVDESWINDRVQLIRRVKNWVNTFYPGTQVGITEYNWGGENHINGATAQADILGIFGREGLDMAARWTTPASSPRPTKRLRCIATTTATSPLSVIPVSQPQCPIPIPLPPSPHNVRRTEP